MATPEETRENKEQYPDEGLMRALQSHETHMRHIYGLRWGGLALSALTITIGAIMVFMGLQGSFNWAVEAPHTISAKLTNASPGIVFATIGLIIGFVVVLQKPVTYETDPGADQIYLGVQEPRPKRRRGGLRIGR